MIMFDWSAILLISFKQSALLCRISEDIYERNAKKIVASLDNQLMVSKHVWYPAVNTEKVTAIANAGILVSRNLEKIMLVIFSSNIG